MWNCVEFVQVKCEVEVLYGLGGCVFEQVVQGCYYYYVFVVWGYIEVVDLYVMLVGDVVYLWCFVDYFDQWFVGVVGLVGGYDFFMGVDVVQLQVDGYGDVMEMWCYVWYEFYWYMQVGGYFVFVDVVGE